MSHDAAPRATFGRRLATALGVHDAGRALRDYATYLPTRAIPALAGLLVLPVLARKLTTSDLGVLALDQTLITLGWTVTGTWLTAAVVREYPAHRQRDDVAGFARVLRSAVGLCTAGVAVFALLVLAAGQVSSAIGDYELYVIAAAAGLAIQNIADSLFAAALRPRAYAVVELSGRIGGIALGIALVFTGHGVAGYLGGLAIGALAAGVPGLAFAWPRAPGEPSGASSVRAWLAYGVPTSTASVSDWALAFIDRYILAGLRASSAVGVYSVGNVIGDRIVSVPLAAFTVATTPALLTAYEHEGPHEVERLMRAYTRVILLLGLPAIAFVGAIAGTLIPALTGSHAYDGAIPVAPVVAGGAILFTLSAIAATGLSVAKHTRPLVWTSLVGLLVNVVANFALIPWLGVMGAAVATPVSTAALLVAVHVAARRHLAWRFPFATLGRACVAAGAGYGAAVAARHVPGGAAASIVAAGAAGAAVYVVVLRILGEGRA
ncbi:MAG TPA: polysaccharide biosynthesis C-terminal domain-containing protein [Gaiellaceae bacterium]|nr:polysaccharide biosynthesis C-terminal domain-containing protein [Gaiellaceae bacterium]